MKKQNSETIQITTRNLNKLKFNQDGLIPVIAQESQTKKVLLFAYMNLASLKQTIKTGQATYWSRSRKKLWIKGLTSGHFQYVKTIYYDCDCDTLLLKVRQVGAACHTLKKTCFYRSIKKT